MFTSLWTLALVLTSRAERADLATHNDLLYTDFQRIAKVFHAFFINYLAT